MGAISASLLVFVCAFGGALLGMYGRRLLPEAHLSSESKDVVRLGMGLVATTVALVLGLLIASAKSFYDTQVAEVTQLAGPTLTEMIGVSEKRLAAYENRVPEAMWLSILVVAAFQSFITGYTMKRKILLSLTVTALRKNLEKCAFGAAFEK